MQQKGKERRAEVAAENNSLGPQTEGNEFWMPSFLHIKRPNGSKEKQQ